MSRILVAGNINHDRIWHLDRPLMPGARLSCSARQTRLGGGAFYTGSQLLQLGHTVLLAGSLMNDEAGQAALSTLQHMGFDTAHISIMQGETVPGDILLDPSGERTIISPPNRKRPPVSLLGPVTTDAIYVNAASCDETVLEAMRSAPFSLAQWPSREMTRPCDTIIGSMADTPCSDAGDLWAQARSIASERLSRVIVTDGPNPVRLIDNRSTLLVQPPARLALTDTIGAGDTFAASYLHAILLKLAPADAIMEACHLTEAILTERQRIQSAT